VFPELDRLLSSCLERNENIFDKDLLQRIDRLVAHLQIDFVVAVRQSKRKSFVAGGVK
jgi:hypothetical protein